MTSKIKQVGRGAGIDKLTTQIHHFLQQFFFLPENYSWEAHCTLRWEGRQGVGGESREGEQERKGQEENLVGETLYLISFDTQF